MTRWLWKKATDSCRCKRDIDRHGPVVTGLNALGERSKCKRFRFSHGLFRCGAVAKYTWNFRHFGNPASVFLALNFDMKIIGTP